MDREKIRKLLMDYGIEFKDSFQLTDELLYLFDVMSNGYLYDTVAKTPVKLYYKTSGGDFLIDVDPDGVNMQGIRKIRYADIKRYELRYL